MIVKKIAEVEAVPVQMEGAKDVSVQVLFGPKDAAPTFALRQFEIAVGGHTPFHKHPFEHEVVVMKANEVADFLFCLSESTKIKPYIPFIPCAIG